MFSHIQNVGFHMTWLLVIKDASITGEKIGNFRMKKLCYFCAIRELIVYEGIRRPSVHPSTFSSDISSEAEKTILFIFHI